MTKFHINPAGEPKLCNASKGRCPFGRESEHYSSKENAQKAYEKINTVKTLSTVSKNTNALQSAKMTNEYAIWSLLNNHLHNASDVGCEAEQYYYSSPIGGTELQRRVTLHAQFKRNRYQEIQEKIDDGSSPKSLLIDDDRTDYQKLLKQGEGELMKERTLKEKLTKDERNAIGAVLIDYSNRWMERLTEKEQRAVLIATSDGPNIISASINPDFDEKEIALTLKTVTKSFENRDYSTYTKSELKEFCNRYTETMNDATKKALILDNPIKIYRGIGRDELVETLGLNDDNLDDEIKVLTSNRRVNDQIEKGRLTKAPLSTSVSSKRANSFAKYIESEIINGAVFEVSAKTISSPVNVSAWSTGELEVYTNANSNYELTGVRIENQSLIIELVEKID